NRARSALVFFGFFVVGEDVVVSPPFEPERAEAVVVAAFGAAVAHRVDRPRPAEDTAARPEHPAAVHMVEFFGLISPVAFGLEELRESGGGLNLLPFVPAAGFEQQNFCIRILRPKGCEDAPR